MGIPATALVLFDIDGTLVRKAGPHHREALVEAVRAITGLDTTTEGIPMQGMLDGDILSAMLQNAGMSARHIRPLLPRIFEQAQLIYQTTCPPLTRRVCPGARQALQRLRRAGVVNALVTGNLSQIAWRKMENAGLRPHFAFGAFAEMAQTRATLARLAIREARKQRIIDRNTPIALIGDHPNDVNAAKINGIKAIAVATGVVGADELRQHQPDLLLDDLRALKPEMILR